MGNWVNSLWKETGFNLLDDKYYIMLNVIVKITNLPAGHQLPTQAKKNVYIIDIHGE